MHSVPSTTHNDMNCAERKIMAFIRCMDDGDVVVVKKVAAADGLTHILYVEKADG